jgi:hypothetical protein
MEITQKEMLERNLTQDENGTILDESGNEYRSENGESCQLESKRTIKGHIAKQYATLANEEIMRWNNGNSLYENEVKEFIDLLEKEMLSLNGY